LDQYEDLVCNPSLDRATVRHCSTLLDYRFVGVQLVALNRHFDDPQVLLEASAEEFIFRFVVATDSITLVYGSSILTY
jgi:hypothetical protein